MRPLRAPEDRAESASVVIDVTDETVAGHGGTVTIGAPSMPQRPSSTLMRPLALLVAVNVLNMLDAALTMLWIEMGVAVEANPVVEAIGFPAKVLGVAAGSYVVYRLKPRWLVVPVIALAAVCAYHLIGAGLALGLS